ncbi:hypothetical protein E2562_033034 [Oryza meyeriana var. granulata]|uniref:Uncharacterized protein n=1 Tax=Oryza meyeriana var. granulata TaxID=110450 RepID=A0A6G1CVW1_9ORYZ|nr:hypothetical protein E2562_033034 [Oryza meyeriana var. granulata]
MVAAALPAKSNCMARVPATPSYPGWALPDLAVSPSRAPRFFLPQEVQGINWIPSVSLRRDGAAAGEEEPDPAALAWWVRAFCRRRWEGWSAHGRKGTAPAGGDSAKVDAASSLLKEVVGKEEEEEKTTAAGDEDNVGVVEEESGRRDRKIGADRGNN